MSRVAAPGITREAVWAALLVAARAIGDRLFRFFGYVGDVFLLGNQTVMHILRGEVTRRECFDQLAAIGVGGLPLVAMTVCFSGMVFGLYGVEQFKSFGATNMLGLITVMSMSREVAPVLAATVVAARSGSAIAAEISTMKITEQLDALRALATSPVEYLAVPRYIALVFTMPMLALVGMAAGTWGAGLVAGWYGVSWREYFSQVPGNMPLDFVFNGCIKAMTFGALIAMSSLRQGFRCGYGSEAVGRTTTQAVVLNIIWIHAANLIIAVMTE